MRLFDSLDSAEDFICSQFGKNLKVATPLGLGKPNQLINRIYNRAKRDSDLQLKLFTALSLDIPEPKSELEKRFVEEFYSRHFGDDYPRLEYLADLNHHRVPQNIQIHEFYFQAGSQLRNPISQRNYISLNYTHVGQSIYDMGIQAIVQLVALSPDGKKCSLSCNPDLTLDLRDLYKKNQRPLMIVGVVHPDLPYLAGDAEVDLDFFDALVQTPEVRHKLFAVPKAPVELTEYMIGFHASRLIQDDGTLQVGIGSLSDAIVYSCLQRQRENKTYKNIAKEIDRHFIPVAGLETFAEAFAKGLYGTSEMLMDGFMHLRKAGILKRQIYDGDEKARRYLHGAFFLGSREFYDWLRNLSGEDFAGLSMTRVSKVNDLYDVHELALRRQRQKARFFNTCMQVSLLGGAASETLQDGRVVSGVGGQYNFVAMSHELPDASSVLLLKSTRHTGRRRSSNIVWSAGALTIPRHLRDVVITEYGIAALKGQSDEVCVQRLLMIADSEFQEELLEHAKSKGKVAAGWQLPEAARNNTPEKIRDFMRDYRREGLFPDFPFGSDFTPVEEKLQAALLKLKSQTPVQLLRTLFKGIGKNGTPYQAELERMKLWQPRTLAERTYRALLITALTPSERKRFRESSVGRG